MKDIAVFGAGGFGREVACLIKKINEVSEEPVWNLIGFFDDNADFAGQQISHFGKCIGGVSVLNEWKSPLSVVIAVGSPMAVRAIAANITNENVDFPNIIYPDFLIVDPDSFKIGKGNIIQGNCSVSCDVTIGDFNVFNGSVVLGHDDVIGNYNSFMPAVRVSGEVKIGDCNFFGVGSIILQGITFKNNTRLAAGSVMMTKPKEGMLYMGVPAKKTEF